MVAQPDTVEGYIASFPPDVQNVLQRVRSTIHVTVPGVEEAISYKMLGFRLDGSYLCYVGGWKQHVGLYPVPRFDDDLEAEIAEYRAAKDSLRFPYRKTVPFDLIGRVVSVIAAERKSA